MSEKAIYFDSSKCTACKGCQVACKVLEQPAEPFGHERDEVVRARTRTRPTLTATRA